MNLPEIFKNEVDENLRHSQEVFYSHQNKIHLDDDFPYFAMIQTKTESFKIKIIGKTTNYLVTENGKTIYLKECLSIKRV